MIQQTLKRLNNLKVKDNFRINSPMKYLTQIEAQNVSLKFF